MVNSEWMKPHQRLDAWKLSFEFVKTVYGITAGFPSDEKFGLVSQLRRASVSVPVNIAEGAARRTKKEFRQFLYISSGSVSELDTLLMLSKELKFVSLSEYEHLNEKLVVIAKCVNGLIRSISVD
jgi:four helix bundle protein